MIPFSPPRIDQSTINEVVDTLQSGWLTTGPKTKKLEKEIELFTQLPKVLCVNSCTAGIELMLHWLGVGEGDEVIVPAYTYCATANVVLHLGATPVMVDIYPSDFTLDIDKVADAITSKTKAIIPVDLGGMPIRYDLLMDLINRPVVKDLFSPTNDIQKTIGRILLITDAAHSLGATMNGRPSATYSDITVYSFHAVKNLTTVEGGAICFNLEKYFDCNKLYNRLNKLTVHGQTKDALAKFGNNSWEYDVKEAGFKINMPDILASIGLVEIGRYREETLLKREQIFKTYTETLEKYEWAEIPVYNADERKTSYHLYLLRIRNINVVQRNLIIQRIFDNGVSVNVHYKPLPELTLYKALGYDINNYPNCLDSYHRVITLPVYFNLTEYQIQKILDVVIEAVEFYLDS